jgi:AcrR family transcriptional regulator
MASPDNTAMGKPILRRDARENIKKLTDAAIQVFLAQGLGAPLDEVARTAGVSNGTLYNRFGNREALIDAVVPIIAADEFARIAAEAQAQPDPWTRFQRYITGLLEFQAGCLVLDDIVARRYPGSQELTTLCDAASRHAATLIEAAQADGSLRDDFRPADLTAIFLANSGIVRTRLHTDGDAWRRHIGFVFDGLRAGSALVRVPRAAGAR